MNKFGKDYRNTQRMHLGLRAILATEISQGLYPEFKKDLIYMKAYQEGEKYLLPHDPSLIGKSISKLETLKILMKLTRDDFEMMIVFNMIPKKYAKILS